MKKMIFGALIIIGAVLSIVSCTCTNQENNQKKDVNLGQTEIVVENAISVDREAMYLKAGEDYRWFETGVVLKDWLDEENDGAIEMVVNVFQTVIERGSGFDTMVYKFQHFDGNTVEDSIQGFWVEDYPLNEEAIKVTFKEAFDKVMAVNMPKPHTRQVVLRKQVGPIDANPQWIFGNIREQIYVDAITGEVSDTNPAFKGLNFGTPLGEWP